MAESPPDNVSWDLDSQQDYASSLQAQLLPGKESEDAFYPAPSQNSHIQRGGHTTYFQSDDFRRLDPARPAPSLGGGELVQAESFPNFDGNVINASSSDPSHSYCCDVGDIFDVEDFLVDDQMIQGSTPAPPPRGNLMVESDSALYFDGNVGASTWDPAILYFGDQFLMGIQQDQGSTPAQAHGGYRVDESDSLYLGGNVLSAATSDPSRLFFGDEFLTELQQDPGSMPAPPPGPGVQLVESSDESHYDGIGDHAYSSDSSVDSDLQEDMQVGGLTWFDNVMGQGMAAPHPPDDSPLREHTSHDTGGPDSYASEDNLPVVDLGQVGSEGRRPWPVVEPGKLIGVGKRNDNETWEARIWLKDVDIVRETDKNGMQCFLGSFATEEEAKRVHDRAAILLDVRVSKCGTLYSLNYPEEQYADYVAAHARGGRRELLWKMRRQSTGKFSKGECELKGVKRKRTGKCGYTASISLTSEIDGKSKKTTMTIGHFETEDEAGREYDKALLFIRGTHDLGCIPNFPPESYTAAEVERVGQQLAAGYPKIDFKGLKRKRSEVFG